MLVRLVREDRDGKIRGVMGVWRENAKWEGVERRVRRMEGNFR